MKMLEMKGQRRGSHLQTLCDCSRVETARTLLDEEAIGPKSMFMREGTESVDYFGRVHHYTIIR